MSLVKETLVNELNLTEKEFCTLADYAYCDHFIPGQMTIQQWQNRMKEAMMEDESFEMESGESIFEPGDKGIIINILNR
jgi:hypothetical protein